MHFASLVPRYEHACGRIGRGKRAAASVFDEGEKPEKGGRENRRRNRRADNLRDQLADKGRARDPRERRNDEDRL